MTKQYVLFEVAENKYAIETTGVVKIVSMKSIIGIPNTPQYVKGLMYIAGRIIVVIDTRARWHYEPKEEDLKTSIIITNFDDEWIGWIVDTVVMVIFFEEEELLPIAWGKLVQETPLVEYMISHGQDLVGVISKTKLMYNEGESL